MGKQAISVTLGTENLLWLRGQAHASGAQSLSAVLDRLISVARAGGRVHEATIRSVVETIAINDADPDLSGANAAIRALFPAAVVAEGSARYRRSKKPAKNRVRARR